MPDRIYQARAKSSTSFVPIRDANYQIRYWGPPDARPLFLLHGTRDTSITFQFVVDALQGRWRVIAPDWRGHGATESANCGGWFHDYLADLDVILDKIAPGTMIDLVGHSLGGNLASVYAALRPGRVRRMIALDAFGIMPPEPQAFAKTLSSWLQGREEEGARKVYATQLDMAVSLCRANSRLPMDKALFLAFHSSRAIDGGGYAWPFNRKTRRSIPTFHSLDEWVACWEKLEAPSLWVAASDPLMGTVRADSAAFEYVLEHIGSDRVVTIAGAGHNLQHDAPEIVAAIIEEFTLNEPPLGMNRIRQLNTDRPPRNRE